jgi:hypothetical protein
MTQMISRFAVTDYAKWWAAFDGYEPTRVEAGVTTPRVYRSTDNSNDLVLVFDVADVSRARDMMGSQDLRTKMKEAGLVGAPKVAFVD